MLISQIYSEAHFSFYFIRDLLKDGATFEVNSDFNRDDEDGIFDDINDGDDDEFFNNLTKKPVMSPWEKSYAELKESMTQLPNGLIWKKIVKEGIGELMPQEKCRATIHYNGYFESDTNRSAFDSTNMRGAPKTFNIGSADILPGIEQAVLTMRKNEESQFVVSYELLFGEMGCVPRIPSKADGLFVIRLLNFTEVGDENAIDKVNEEDKRKFSVILPKIREIQIKAKDLFSKGHTSNACRAFHNAIKSLEFCQLCNETEQKQQQEYLIKLYTNLAVCYNKMGLWKKTCSMCNEIGRLTDLSKNSKALFQEGRALLKLGEFQRAREKLRQSQYIEPSNKSICQELILLEETYKKQKDEEQDIWKRAFGNKNKDNRGNGTTIDDAAFRDAILKIVHEFKADNEQRFVSLPEGLTSNELSNIESLVENLSLKIDVTYDHRNKIIHKLVKQ